MQTSRLKYLSLTTLMLVNLSCYCAHDNKHYKQDVKIAGDILSPMPILAGLTVTYLKQDLEGAKQLGRSFLVTGTIAETLKYTINKTSWGERPNGGEHSFPSGHTTFACVGAAFLGERYGWEYGLPALAVAGVVATSRVVAEKHHVRDVVAGCAIAYVVNEFFVINPEQQEIIPVIGPEFLGFRFKWDY